MQPFAHPGSPAHRPGPTSGAIWTGALCGLGAAALFGASAPLAKLLVGRVEPAMLAGLLYLGAGVGLTFAKAARGGATREAPLAAADVPMLLVVIAAGGVIGPVLMLIGLQRVSGVAGALLLNLEAPFTMLVAVALFGEHLGRRDGWAVGAILAGGMLLAGSPSGVTGEAIGVLALAGACASWAVDNNVTQRLALKDPVALVRIKALGAAIVNLIIALGLGASFPSWSIIAAAVVLGILSYGVSIVLDTYALRIVGAAREAALFATAPFFGALVALPVLGERLGTSQLIAGSLMAGGVILLLRSRHEHVHGHEPLVHDHHHEHDEHHRHTHDTPVPPGEKHSHVHAHEPLVHDHPHVSDAHHRHPHRT